MNKNQGDKTQYGGAKTGSEQNQKTARPDQGQSRHMNETQSGDQKKRDNDTGAQRNIDENRSGSGSQNWSSERRDAAADSNERDRNDREGARNEGGANQNFGGQRREPGEGRGQMSQNQQHGNKQQR